MTKVIDNKGNEVFFEVAINLMDDEIREKLHMDLAPCTDQEFFDAYCAQHFEKYGEEFMVE